MKKYIIVLIVILLASCDRSDFHTSIDMKWKPINNKLPNDIVLYEGYNSSVPLRAWAVVIPKNNKNQVKVLMSSDEDGLDTPKELASKVNAIVAINGGYFTRGKFPVHHVGLLKTNNILIEPASGSVIRENIRYKINRGVFGIFDDGNVDICWSSTRNDSIFKWDSPVNNRPGNPGTLDYKKAKFWDAIEALHAGPVLIKDGKINVTTEEEVFFNTPVDGVQPRSAIGYKNNGDIIFMVIDGRQVDSRGAYLKELAMLMAQFHCYEALNLDGGGSSTLIVNGELINSPIGLNTQRQVMSAIAIISKN